MPGYGWLPTFIPIAWLVFTLVIAGYLTSRKTVESPHEMDNTTDPLAA